MYKLLNFNQLFENNDSHWTTIKLPDKYPNVDKSYEWLEDSEKVINKIVKCLSYEWDYMTDEYEFDEIEIFVIKAYQYEGYIYFVDDKILTHKVIGEEIKVKNVDRVFSKEDPYGEEIWENKLYELKTGDEVRYIGWDKNYRGINGKIEKIDSNSHALVHFDDGRYIWVILSQLSNAIETRIFSEEDPYGEEIWENSNNEISNIIIEDLKKHIIVFDNEREMIVIAKALKSIGIEVFNYDEIINGDVKSFSCFMYDYNHFVRSTSLRGEAKYSYDEFINIVGINKKFKKIENPIDDPYGEEDWGYEEMKENEHHRKNFEIGDVVRHKKYPGFGVGVVKYIDDTNTIYIEFENKTYRGCPHTKKDRGWSTNDRNIEWYDFINSNKKFKKIENSELDPYGEEDWGWEEIKENVENNEIIEFIPFEQREKIDSDFKWTKKIENIVYYTEDEYNGYRKYSSGLNKNRDYLKKMEELLIGNFVQFYKFDYENGEFKEPIKFKVKLVSYNMLGIIHIVSDKYITGLMDERKPIKITKKKRIFREDDPYGEEEWDVNESKINEIFDTNTTYEYKYVKTRKMMQFTDVVFTFTSKDDVQYFVTVSYNEDHNSMSVKFTDKANFKGIRNKVKDKYVNMDNYDAINVLNTVVKICKDFYDKNKEIIKSFTTSTLDEKRLRIYKYILSKYFKGWEVSSYVDPRGDIVIECEPKKINEGHEDVDPYGEEDWNGDNELKIGDSVVCVDTNRAYNITIDKIYKILDFDRSGDPYIINDKRDVGNYCLWRFKKVKLNEAHEDVDPYGEEDWDDEPELKIGDEVICIRSAGASFYITLGAIYTIKKVQVFGNDHYVGIQDKFGIKTQGHKADRFKKIK